MKTIAPVLLLLAAPLSGEGASSSDFTAGEIVPKVATRHDAGQQYSLYLPSAYDPEKTWPVLFVLDPRGRAEPALRLFVDGAEANGWIVLSSYQSRSDTLLSVTTEAFQALLKDVDRFSVDPRRLYIAGMSGTSFAAWRYAAALPGNVAGVIGCGGGLPRELDSPGPEVHFAYFGMAGTTDFNLLEQRRLEDQLTSIEGAVHRFEAFDGRHGWPPEDTWTRAAVDWLELMAVKRGLAKRSDGWIDGELATARAAARAASEPLAALRRYDQLARDFDGLRDVAEERRRAAELERSPEVAKARAREKKLAGEERAFLTRFSRWMARLNEADRRPPMLGRSLAELRVAHLTKQAADDSDPAGAEAAERQLEIAYVRTVFYLPNQYETAGDLERAAAVLELAAAIFPDRPRAHWRRAAVYAEAGNRDRAFEALRAAAALGGADVERLKSDRAWDRLREDRRWQELLDRLALEQRLAEPPETRP